MNENTDLNDLTDFLLAQIAEVERSARLAGPAWRGNQQVPNPWLAECEAKRRIVSHMQIVAGIVGPRGDDARAVLTWLALPYDDHPDFREEWKS